MFNMVSRHLLNVSVQIALDCISENFNLKSFSGGACPRISLEKCAARSPDGRYRAHIATVCYISRPPLTKSSVRLCFQVVALYNARKSWIFNEDQSKLAFSTTKNIFPFSPLFPFPHFIVSHCFLPPRQPRFYCFPSARGYGERCKEKKTWLRKSFNRIEKNCVTNQTEGCLEGYPLYFYSHSSTC